MCFLYLHLPLHMLHTRMCSSDKLTGTRSLFRLYISTVLLLPETKQTNKKQTKTPNKTNPPTNSMQANCIKHNLES